MLLWDATNLPEGFLDPLSQCLEGFAEGNAGSFDVGVGQHKVIDHVRKGFSCNGHAQILHMREIGLGSVDSDLGVAHRAAQTRWTLAALDRVRVVRPPRASLAQTDWCGWPRYEGA